MVERKEESFMGVTVADWQKVADAILQCEEVSDILIYGSRARGNYKRFSDIDLTLLGDGLRHTDLFGMLDRIDYLNLPYEIDLSILSEINYQPLLEEISQNSISLMKLLNNK